MLIALCFAVSVVNTAFRVQNYGLKSQIEAFVEDRSILRAKYFSEISAGNLAERAEKFKMVQISNKDTIIIKTNHVSGLFGLQNFSRTATTKFFRKLEKNNLRVSGY